MGWSAAEEVEYELKYILIDVMGTIMHSFPWLLGAGLCLCSP
jgi:hypothetical protein